MLKLEMKNNLKVSVVDRVYPNNKTEQGHDVPIGIIENLMISSTYFPLKKIHNVHGEYQAAKTK